ncbi:MAG: PDZ domain-containing protein [Clostridia bacterium]|nr:PDZ domain-containing protein [Clostridia bacterium]
MQNKQVPLGRTILCVVLCAAFAAFTTFQFAYYASYADYRSELSEHAASMTDTLYLNQQQQQQIADLQASLEAHVRVAENLAQNMANLTGNPEGGSVKDCLRYLVRSYLARCHVVTGVPAEHLDEEVDAYMAEYADDFLSIVERLLFVDYLYRTHYLGDAPNAEDMQEAVLEGYIAAAGDVYAHYYTPEEYEAYRNRLQSVLCGIGIVTTSSDDGKEILVLHVHSHSPAKEAGIEAGDRIVAVDGKTVAETGYEAAISSISGEEGSSVTVKLIRSFREETYTITREKVNSDAVICRSYKENGKKIGYIRLLTFSSDLPRQLKEAYAILEKEGVEALVFDVRDNTGGLLSAIIEVLDFILPKGTPLVSYEYKNPYTQKEVQYAESEHTIDLPMYVLQNGKTASAAELFCAAMGDHATLIGETTYGKGKMQTGFRLEDGSYITVTVARYNSPAIENYDGVGVPAEVEKNPTGRYADMLIYLLPENEDTPLKTALSMAGSK